MPIRRKKLWKQCRKCNEMYPAKTKAKGICPKCNQKKMSWIDRLAVMQQNRSESTETRQDRRKC